MNCPGCGWDGFDPAIHLACDGTDGPVAPWTDEDEPYEPWEPEEDWPGGDEGFLTDLECDPVEFENRCYAGEGCLIHGGSSN